MIKSKASVNAEVFFWAKKLDNCDLIKLFCDLVHKNCELSQLVIFLIDLAFS